jgi:hypothetical protein
MMPTVAFPPPTPSTCQVTDGTLEVTGETVTSIGAQPSQLAVPGVRVAEVGVTTTSARSTRFASSVTVSRRTNEPCVGGSTTATAGSVTVKLPEPHCRDHSYATILRPTPATLGSPESATPSPGVKAPLTTTSATGRNAASSAPGAFAIPAPQVSVVQLHSQD